MCEYLNTCMQVFISMQTRINPPVCVDDVIIQNNHNNMHGAMRTTVHMQLILLNNSMGGLGLTGRGSLLNRSSSLLCVSVCVDNFYKRRETERKKERRGQRKEKQDTQKLCPEITSFAAVDTGRERTAMIGGLQIIETSCIGNMWDFLFFDQHSLHSDYEILQCVNFTRDCVIIH